MDPAFFATLEDWRDWLEKNHRDSRELLVGFYKRGSGRQSITWPESVDGALCFGWIDGVRRSVDEVSYSIRFTPRKRLSTWSGVNIKRVAELTAQGLMRPAGLEAYQARKESRSAIYSFEQGPIAFELAQEQQFRRNKAGWNFFRSKPPWYQRAATWWVVSAKRPETRQKRLSTLIEDSEAGRTIAQLTRKGASG